VVVSAHERDWYVVRIRNRVVRLNPMREALVSLVGVDPCGEYHTLVSHLNAQYARNAPRPFTLDPLEVTEHGTVAYANPDVFVSAIKMLLTPSSSS
jgi:hypothetical protein